MACIVYQTNKRTGTRYAYRSESFRDPDTGAPRSRREYLGRVDPATGEIVPKGTGGRRNTTPLGRPGDPPAPGDARLELAESRARVAELEGRVAELESQVASLLAAIGTLVETARGVSQGVEGAGLVAGEAIG